MCGVFGFVAKGRKPVNLRILKQIAEVTMLRGPHAWGMAWVDGRGRVKSYKQAGRIADRLPLLNMARGSQMLIGHCRYATHGDPANNLNNHPHDGGDAWIVHNGVIRHYEEIMRKHRLRPHTQCDSEVLGLMLQKFRGRPLTRMARACNEAIADNPFSAMALWPDRVLAARANAQPLHIGETRDAYWIASLAYGLPGQVEEFPEGKVLEFADSRKRAA